MTTRTIADSLKAATAGIRKRDVIDVRQDKPKTPRLKPTPEQMAKVTFEKVVGGDAAGAYQRLPLFETLFKRCDFIDQDGLAAMRWYRDRHDSSAASPTRCALNDEGRGGGVPICIPFAIAGMRVEDLQFGSHLDLIEQRLGALLPTMRAVILGDKSFSQVAVERFGGRRQTWIEQNEACGTDRRGKRAAFVDKVVPQGHHRAIVSDEFRAGLKLLVQVHAPYVSTGARPQRAAPSVTETEAALVAMVSVDVPAPAVDPEFLNDAGRMREFADIAEIIRARAFGGEQLAA